ncbi:MAG: NUDIX hydrolase [Bacillota bacterium]|nr:NUDIX hydrolase [Bacillota bacterium]
MAKKAKRRGASTEEARFLAGYREEDYERLSLTVDILLFTLDSDFGLRVLLKKREEFPFKDHWALPGGFVRIDESVEAAAMRVMKEKTGLSDLHLEQLYTFGDRERDPRMRIVTVAYLAVIPRGTAVASDGTFFRVDDSRGALIFGGGAEDGDGQGSEGCGRSFDASRLAFDHADIVALALERMRGKLNYTDLALEFLKDRRSFTLYELQKVYEAIENKGYDTPNFRRYFKNRYEATGAVERTEEMSTEFSKRPSAMYRLIGQRST